MHVHNQYVLLQYIVKLFWYYIATNYLFRLRNT
jgi:hypothetical protein